MKHIYISACDKQGGIYHYLLEGGKLVFQDKTDLDQPMYTVFKDGKLWVLLKETDEVTRFGSLMSFEVDEKGKLVNPSQRVSTKGICPCHLAVTDRDVYVVNYVSGNVTSKNGLLDQHEGKGVLFPRQEGPHTHFIRVSPEGKYLLSCDLGLDSIFTYDFDLKVVSVSKVPAGHGARHLDYSEDGKYVYCINELASTVSVFSYADGILTLQNTCSCTQKEGTKSTAAAIRVHKGFLYGSNRGYDTIACFKIAGDKLTFVSEHSVEGSFPRDFIFAGDYLICTNEHTNNVTVFEVHEGRFQKTDEVKGLPDPLCATLIER